jgi:Protein of unknown function (DUF4256)
MGNAKPCQPGALVRAQLVLSTPEDKPMKIQERKTLLAILKARFEQNMVRHEGLIWDEIGARLEGAPTAMQALAKMESTGGEPDVIGHDGASDQYIFCDCSAESPVGRRSLCFDAKALASRKENKPKGSALQAAAEIGVQVLTEEQYRRLQQLGEFDTKTSSWIATPDDVRSLGGALFCDRRYGKVFVYHNGAESYYAVRGFRGVLRV